MRHEAIKLELIRWLSQLEDLKTIEYLKIVKDSQENEDDWWNALTDSQQAGIERGLNDIRNGRTIAHEDVREKYGL